MGQTVLVADDSLTIQRMAAGILAGAGLEVVTVSNGVTAIRKLPTAKPNVIVADVSMPGKDGYEVCDFVKNSPELGHVSVLLAVSDMEPYDEGRGAQVRADGIVRKPFDPAELVAAVRKSMLAVAPNPPMELDPGTEPARPLPGGKESFHAVESELADTTPEQAGEELEIAGSDMEAGPFERPTRRGGKARTPELTLEEGLAFGDLPEPAPAPSASAGASAAITQPEASEAPTAAEGEPAAGNESVAPESIAPPDTTSHPVEPAIGRIVSEYPAGPWTPPATAPDAAQPTAQDEQEVLADLLRGPGEPVGADESVAGEVAPARAEQDEVRAPGDTELAWYTERPTPEGLLAETDHSPAPPVSVDAMPAADSAGQFGLAPAVAPAEAPQVPAIRAPASPQERGPSAEPTTEGRSLASLQVGLPPGATIEQIVEKVVRRMSPPVLSPETLREITRTLASEITGELHASR